MRGFNDVKMRRRSHPKGRIVERDLLGLPISLNLGIPLVDTLLAPLTGGQKTSSTTAPTATPTTPTPASTTPPSAPSDTPPAETPPNSPASTATPTQDPASAPQTTASVPPTTGGGTSENPGGGSVPGGVSQPLQSGSAAPSDVSPSPTNVTPNGNNALVSNPAAVPTSDPNASSVPFQSAAVNVQSAFDSVNANGPSGSLAGAVTQPTGGSSSVVPGSRPGPGVDGGSGGGNDDSGSDTPGSGKHGLSKGAIVAISIIAVLLGLVALFFLLRRSSISKRMARRRRWFRNATNFGRPVSNDDYFARNHTSWSSFGTNIDQGQTPHPSVPPDSSWPPEMIQRSLASGPFPFDVPFVPPVTVGPALPVSATNELAHTSERPISQGSQYLIAPDVAVTTNNGSATGPLPSPISVRPFSPSESWQFPKPPKDDLKRQSQAIVAANKSRSSLNTVAKSTRSHASLPTNEEYVTAPEGDLDSQDPFADSSVDTHGTEFTGYSHVSDTSASDHFHEIEIIRRPFVPKLGDELGVSPGDQIRIRKRFHDGWACGERIKDGKTGVFPIDCLRLEDQPLPVFLAEKRISDYSSDPFTDQVVN